MDRKNLEQHRIEFVFFPIFIKTSLKIMKIEIV